MIRGSVTKYRTAPTEGNSTARGPHGSPLAAGRSGAGRDRERTFEAPVLPQEVPSGLRQAMLPPAAADRLALPLEPGTLRECDGQCPLADPELEPHGPGRPGQLHRAAIVLDEELAQSDPHLEGEVLEVPG